MIAAEAVTLTALGFLEEFIDAVLGASLLIFVWLFGISTPVARATLIGSGIVVLLFSFYEIWNSWRTPVSQT
jgi:hypothetical protein